MKSKNGLLFSHLFFHTEKLLKSRSVYVVFVIFFYPCKTPFPLIIQVKSAQSVRRWREKKEAWK